ncbi:MAG: hypothetical protein JST84_29265 [Acidobacteria bacterium]|nr:hypothetical protein [Acidobacteriota bacterium]
MNETASQGVCEKCQQPTQIKFEHYINLRLGESATIESYNLCVRCARQLRHSISREDLPEPDQITREELIDVLDRFWNESGAGEICRRCHMQGTGCCPPMCRYLGDAGCQKKNVFCTSFVCSALLNGISECDAEMGRLVKWIKSQIGSAEFRLYEMVTRVPQVDREAVRPLALPRHYPKPLKLDGERIKPQLAGLADEILEIRRRWHEEELEQVQPMKMTEEQGRI